MPPQPAATSRYSLEKLSIFALLITLVGGMFLVIPSSTVPLSATKAFALAAGTLLTLAIYILARLSRGNIIVPPLALVGALWLPTIAYALSAAFSGVAFSNALWGSSLEVDTLGFMLTSACLGTLVALSARRAEHYRLFLTTSAWAFGVVALLQAVIIITSQFSPSTVAATFTPIGSFSSLAFVLGLGVISTLVAARFIELSKQASRALLVSTAIALGLLAVANSSLVWTLVALVALGFFVEAVMRRGGTGADADLTDLALIDETPLGKDSGNHSLVRPLVVLAIALFFLVGGKLGGALATSLQANVLNVRPSWQSTLSIAKKTYATSSLFGTGPNTFSAEWLKHRDASLNSTVFWNTSFMNGVGVIPTSFVTTGLVGVVAWLALLGLFAFYGLRMLLRRTPQDPYVRSVAILSFVATLYLFIIALFDLPNAVVLVAAFAFAGLFASTMRYASGSKQLGIIFSRSPRIGFVIVFVLTLSLLSSVAVAYALTGRYLATADIARAQSAYAAGNLSGAEKALQDSLSFAPSALAYQFQAGIAVTRLNQVLSTTTLSKTQAQQTYQTTLSSGINAALTATNLDPSNAQGWLMLGNLYAQAVPLGVSGAYDSAKTAYTKAKALDPTNPQILLTIAQLDIANKDSKSAREDLKAAITLKQDYTDAIFLLSQLEVQEGNVKEALDAALAAAYFTPNNPNILFQVGILSAALGDFAGSELALAAAVAANPQFANARYFLAAVTAKQGGLAEAITQLKAIAMLSSENAASVAPLIAALEAGKNPFPANLFSTPSTPVK